MKLDFIIIGAHRTGTTWLYENLFQHPEILLSTKQKELHFFDRDQNYSQGVKYYKEFFSNNQKNKLIGESTPAYLSEGKVPERIFSHFPEAKLIVILRNPIDRLYSHYKLNCGNHNVKESFANFYERKTKEKNEGIYMMHIERYLKYFSRDQMMFIIYDDIKDKPDDVYKSVLQFIGTTNCMFVPSTIEKRINSWGIKKYNSKSRVLYRIMLILKRLKLFKLSAKIELLNSNNKKETIDSNDRRILQDFYKKSIDDLEKFLGISLKHWSE